MKWLQDLNPQPFKTNYLGQKKCTMGRTIAVCLFSSLIGYFLAWRIQSSQTGGLPHGDTSPYKVFREYSLCKRKYFCMADLLFYLLGFSSFAYIESTIDLLFGQISTSQSGGQLYSDTSTYKVSECSFHYLPPSACIHSLTAILSRKPNTLFYVKWAIPYFRSFQTNVTIFTPNICEKCPPNVWCWDLNPQPSEHESPPVNSRTGLPPNQTHCCHGAIYLEE